jgi:hypothetical protein
MSAMGIGRSLSSGRREAGPVGQCDEAGGDPNAGELCSMLSQ